MDKPNLLLYALMVCFTLAYGNQTTNFDSIEELLSTYGNQLFQSGNMVAVTTGDRTSQSIKIFKQNEHGYQFIQQLNSDEPNDFYGQAIALDNDLLVVGAPNSSLVNRFAGLTYIYRWQKNKFRLDQYIFADNANRSDFFGTSVAISNNYIAIGAPEDDEQAKNSGAVYVYEYTDQLEFKHKLKSNNIHRNEYFGQSIDMFVNELAVGAWGHCNNQKRAGQVSIYRLEFSDWHHTQTITPSYYIKNEAFGYKIALIENFLVVGAPANSEKKKLDGIAYVFEKIDEVWVEENKVYGTIQNKWDGFGQFINNYRIGDSEVITISGKNQDHFLQLDFTPTERMINSRGDLTSYHN